MTKHLITIFLAVLLSSHAVCHAQTSKKASKSMTKSEKTGVGYYLWPVFFGGGSFFLSEEGIDVHRPGYVFSGGLTFSIFERHVNFLAYTGNLFLFSDALYSYRAYDGLPQTVNYSIEETTLDVAAGAGFNNLYLGIYTQFPNRTTIRVREWTIEDFDGISRTTSFSFMMGFRMAGDNLGMDLRFLFGQGPGKYLRSSLGDHWLGQVSIGVMAGF